MIKQEIVEKISKYFKLTSFEAEKIYDDIFAGIIKGVNDENIADVTNLGEFIIKYNSGDENNKKTVEFLPTLSLEGEINQRAFEEGRQFEPEKFQNNEALNNPEQVKTPEIPVVPPIVEEFSPVSAVDSNIPNEHLSIEDEIKRKRE